MLVPLVISCPKKPNWLRLSVKRVLNHFSDSRRSFFPAQWWHLSLSTTGTTPAPFEPNITSAAGEKGTCADTERTPFHTWDTVLEKAAVTRGRCLPPPPTVAKPPGPDPVRGSAGRTHDYSANITSVIHQSTETSASENMHHIQIVFKFIMTLWTVLMSAFCVYSFMLYFIIRQSIKSKFLFTVLAWRCSKSTQSCHDYFSRRWIF